MRPSSNEGDNRRHGVCRTMLVLGAVTALVIACRPTQPPAIEPLPPLLDFPAAYRVEAAGTVALDSTEVRGNLRMDYLVFPDQRAAVTRFDAWIDDIDYSVPFLWWEVQTESLRCTQLGNRGSWPATLAGETLVVPAARAGLGGSSYDTRKADGCVGATRRLKAANPDPIEMTHDPASDRFALIATFAATHEGEEFEVAIDAEGTYVNRPPTAQLEHALGDGAYQAGCPPSKAIAEDPRGLTLELRSTSFDPDGLELERFNSKYPRADLRFEQWARSTPEGRFAYLGEGQSIPPQVFEPGREHAVVLTVTDRSGSRSREVCSFHVEAAS